MNPLDSSVDFDEANKRIRRLLGLQSDPVSVFFVRNEDEMTAFQEWTALKSHRYCQALMKARRGQRVVLTGDEIACPAAASAFGFRPLPEGLSSGKGLVGFGIVKDAETGKRMFEGMTRFASDEIRAIALCPLSASPRTPDVVVVEEQVERLMWLLLADLNLQGGTRRQGNTAVLQATCVDSTIIPFVEQRMNFCLGCYGCREATDIGSDETVLGFPGAMLGDLLNMLEYLSEKAMPRSRQKQALQRLDRKEIG